MSIELLQECVTNEGYTPIEVASSSNPHRHYIVLCAPWLHQREYICECEGYQYRHQCRHQMEAAVEFCGWTQLDGPEEQDVEQAKNKICPRCERPTKYVMEEVAS